MRTLLVTSYIPHRDIGHGGGKVLAEIASYFASRHELSIISFCHHPDELRLAKEIEGECAYFKAVPLPLDLPRLTRCRIRSLLRGEPLLVACYDVPSMWKEVRSVLESRSFDLLQLDLPWMGQYVSLVRGAGVRTVLLELDVAVKPLRRSYEQEQSRILRLWRRRQLRSMERYEPRICRQFDLVYAASEEERELLLSLDSELEVSLLRYGINEALLEVQPKLDSGHTLVFLGSFGHPPNVDAALYFCESVWPCIREQIPDAELHLVGGSPPDAVTQLGRTAGVTVTGWVPDVGAHLAKADVCVVPLRRGGGVKLKTLEMMAAGRPVVTTSVGSEGIAIVDDRHALIANSPDEFASKVVALLHDDEARQALAAEGRALVRREHRWDVSLGRLERECQELVAQASPAAPVNDR